MMRSSALWVCLLAALARARELDPAACASRFDVQRDKIIRTEESREMGARYLSELDVGARAECLRLCCETDNCDVFVFEEKSPGSCYLFTCGPPEDFRCKFTAHGNFSSGVLAVSRRLAELQDQETLASHEQQLASLRVATTTTARSTTTTVTAPAPRPPPAPKPPQTPGKVRRCSRYQFECHTGGECIAVYNACDGVPQCADGSDEAPELGCPSAPPLDLAPPSTTTTPPPPTLKAVPEPVDPPVSNSLAESPVGERWPHRLAQAQPPHRFTANEPATGSHIFSHKGGLLQEPETNVMSGGMMGQYPAFETPWQRRTPWNQPAPGMENMVGGWGGQYPRYDWPEADPRRAWPVPQPRPEPEMPVYLPPKTMPETVGVYSNQQHTLRDSPKKGFDLMSKQTQPEVATERAAPADLEDIKVEKTTVIESTTKKKELKAQPAPASKPAPVQATKRPEPAHQHFTAMDDHDGLSEHPPAAVMLLVLGILMTSVMGVMLACRARSARRRLRRGKSPFAHDADYLVNGMYL
ncbi:uncharacterized protein LOC119694051 isoform X2 [Plutella xylostella]|uniref:uncharacterized protein LOC119694051 isoform X2 n=1 Tax=Plutella xylostella TaxID=51655 RepID=UPI0020323575|nr:uncharacterized protein LOC119694051 isoform X2 [Plutella xylostella]